MNREAARSLRGLLERDAITIAPLVFNPLTAQLAERAGFEVTFVGGYGIGADFGVGEPLLTATEMVEATGRIANAVSVPVVADAGAGFGTLVHTRRVVRDFEQVGTAGIHIEDQIVPKRVGYHRGQVDIVPMEEMVAKIRVALDSRRDPAFVLIARTDARGARNGGFEEMRRRVEAYAAAGADAIMCFPADEREAGQVPGWIDKPALFVMPEGRKTRPDLDTATLERLGYRMAIFSEGSLLASYAATKRFYESVMATGKGELPPEEMAAHRKDLESTIGIPQLYPLEDIEWQLAGLPFPESQDAITQSAALSKPGKRARTAAPDRPRKRNT
jgi:2-methylisocitrate lyase-like PEP mutase family enzyme